MYIDIHKHGYEDNDNVIVLRNLFPENAQEIRNGKYYSIGLHPWYVNPNSINQNLQTISIYAKNKEVIAIGETGLDKKVNIPYPNQIIAFEKQLEIAEDNNLPVIIHCVKAYNDIISIRKKARKEIPWIIHWFNTSVQIAQKLIDLNCFLSYGNMLFKENSKAFSGFLQVPLDKIFFETDDTEYTIWEIYKKAAFIRNMSVSELQEAILSNFSKCFNI